jgi:hypothetical protein
MGFKQYKALKERGLTPLKGMNKRKIKSSFVVLAV